MKTRLFPIAPRLGLHLVYGTAVMTCAARLGAQELIVNGSFENTGGTFVGGPNSVMSLPIGSTIIPGWTTIDAELAWLANTNPYGLTSPFGTMFLDLTGLHDALPYGGITQTVATLPNQSYQLSLALGANQQIGVFRGPVTVAVVVGSVSNSFTFTPQPPSTGNLWMNFTTDFAADAASTPVTIVGVASQGGQYLGLDNVSLMPQSGGLDLLTNGSFENVTGTFVPDANGVMSLPAGSTTIPGWTTLKAELFWARNTNHFNVTSPYGSMFLDLTGYHDALPYAGVTQTAPTVAGQTYSLSFSLGADQDVAAYSGPMSVSAQAGSISNSFTFTPPGTGTQWGVFTLNFTATSSTTPISIWGTLATGGQFLGLDQVSVMPQASGFRITSIERSGNDVRVSFPSLNGSNYTLQTKTNLNDAQWTPIPATTTAGNGSNLQITLSNALNQQTQFIRVEQSP